MLLNKTDKARAALRAGSAAGLALQDRRILIVVDGRRGLDEMMGLLGAGILPAVDRLLREGYLMRATPARAPAGPVAGLLRAATDAVQARTEQIRAATAAAPAPTPQAALAAPPPAPAHAPRGAPRRSLAASKMYLLDMLQLQRSAEAASLRSAVQCATDPEQLLDALLQALRLIVAASTPGMGERVSQRLAEILPLDALPRLAALRATRAAAPALSIVA